MESFDPLASERNQKLLKILVERYIKDGCPVGSKTIAEEVQQGVSSATIRNVMADLEEAGFLRSPHTSSGRIPTTKGYRFFVDELLSLERESNQEAKAAFSSFRPALQECIETKELLGATSNLLSGITKFASIIMLPRREAASLKQIEFLPLTENRILVILVFGHYEVQNRIIYTKRHYQSHELQQAANYINQHFAGMDLAEIRRKLVVAMREDQQNLADLLDLMVSTSEQALANTNVEQDNCVTAGEQHLLDLAETADINKLKDLFDTFTQKSTIIQLLDQCIEADGIKIYIGEESGYSTFDDCSLVTATYSLHDQVIGVLGVIGPTRMQYDRVISAVSMTSKLLGSVLEAREV
ncbi:MAG: heat-inducible transcriptional repressor HrcA [Gammaproteobacteria bacterium]